MIPAFEPDPSPFVPADAGTQALPRALSFWQRLDSRVRGNERSFWLTLPELVTPQRWSMP